MNRSIATLACACVWTAAGVLTANAQGPIRLSGGATVAQMRVHSENANIIEAFSAPELGFEATVAVRRLALRIRYAQADLPLSTAAVYGREAAEGQLALTAEVLPWLRLGTGGRARSYDAQGLPQRWMMWEAIVATELPIFRDVLTGSAELRGALTGSVDGLGAADSWDSGYAGEVGMRLSLPRIPVWLRFGYRLEIQKLGGGARREVVDGLTVLVGVGPR